MDIRLIVCVLTSAVVYVSGQSSLGKCTRPNGEEGLCIRYDQCPEILQQLTSSSRNNQELTKYKCGFDGKIPKVCCNYNCYTPEGNLGKCQHVNSCQHLNDMTKTTDKNLRAYVRNSRCLTGARDVCCGPPPAADIAQPSEDCAERTSAFPPHTESTCCGMDAQSASKIVGGNSTGIDEYPWLALLEYKKKNTGEIKSYCGGALISNKYVVTAAHCIKGPGAWPPLRVKLGEYDTSTEKDCVDNDCADPVVTIDIEDIITHPEYNPTNSRNDIALIRLASPAPFTDFVRPICLPAANVGLRSSTERLEAFVAGWGKVNLTHTRSQIKQHVKVPIVPTQDCQNSFSSRMLIPPILSSNQLCAGGEAGKDSCNGDSGGPLMLKTGLLHELIGVVSFGLRQCGTKGLPGIYTHVHTYSTWIRNNIRP